jgi:aminodeoxyfutalosine synthase
VANNLFSKALEKGAEGERLNREEALALVDSITPDTLHELGAAVFENRHKRFSDRATYVFNIHVNPANICVMGCSFCNYAATLEAEHAFVMEENEIISKVDRLNPTEVHITGGLNNIWPYKRNLDLIRELRMRFPGLYIKSYTAVEIAFFARSENKGEGKILQELFDAGMNALPGGGAEIFSERLYATHWKRKIGPRDWIRIHKLAHSLGIPTNATMLFGFGDIWKERVEHMLILRKVQDESGGFVCFIPLAFQPGEGNFVKQGPTPLNTLAVTAISRLVIDNITHLKSYWPMSGLETAAAGLSWGADDLDGTITEEKIAHLSGAPTPVGMARGRMIETISLAGFTPVERDGQFKEREMKDTSLDRESDLVFDVSDAGTSSRISPEAGH